MKEHSPSHFYTPCKGNSAQNTGLFILLETYSAKNIEVFITLESYSATTE
ncbi:MAG TPA: hypothetical protein VFC69_05325 [Dysgonamonadaceae bacterium]|nr:hypothetical protein [Dysgonamonadaceae bacterium]